MTCNEHAHSNAMQYCDKTNIWWYIFWMKVSPGVLVKKIRVYDNITLCNGKP